MGGWGGGKTFGSGFVAGNERALPGLEQTPASEEAGERKRRQAM